MQNRLKFIVLLSVVVSMTALADRNVFWNSNNNGYFGLRVALDVTSPGSFRQRNSSDGILLTQKYLGSRCGLSVGAVYNMPVVANLYFEPGVSVFYNTTSVRYDVHKSLPIEYIDNIYAVVNAGRTVKQWGMRIPLDLGYRFDLQRNFSLSVFTGPVLNIGFAMDGCMGFKLDNTIFYSESSLYSTGNSQNHDRFNRVSLAWRVGIAANIRNFYIGLSGNLGLTNLYHVAPANRDAYRLVHRQNLFQLTVGYDLRP